MSAPNGGNPDDLVRVDKAKLREMLSAYDRAMDAYSSPQSQENIWPMLICLGAALDVVLTQLAWGPTGEPEGGQHRVGGSWH
jgi:hypothetical protein